MRDFKFRVWDKKDSCMRNVVGLQFTVAGNRSIAGIKYARVLGGDGMRSGENVDLMQFTGLLDKNGVEIYEGDIVDETLWLREQKEAVRQEIRWSPTNAGFWVGTGSPLTKGYSEDIEVIGNIYANKELLK